jgi:hypothetical protein
VPDHLPSTASLLPAIFSQGGSVATSSLSYRQHNGWTPSQICGGEFLGRIGHNAQALCPDDGQPEVGRSLTWGPTGPGVLSPLAREKRRRV